MRDAGILLPEGPAPWTSVAWTVFFICTGPSGPGPKALTVLFVCTFSGPGPKALSDSVTDGPGDEGPADGSRDQPQRVPGQHEPSLHPRHIHADGQSLHASCHRYHNGPVFGTPLAPSYQAPDSCQAHALSIKAAPP